MTNSPSIPHRAKAVIDKAQPRNRCAYTLEENYAVRFTLRNEPVQVLVQFKHIADEYTALLRSCAYDVQVIETFTGIDVTPAFA